MARRNKVRQEQRELLGQKVKYIGIGGMKFKCEQCSLTRSKGMISVYEEMRFCSEQCVVAYIEQKEE